MVPIPFPKLFCFAGTGADSDLALVVARRDLRLLLRGHTLGYLFLLTLLVPGVVFAGMMWFGTTSPGRVGADLFRDSLVASHFVTILLASASWALGMVVREVRAGRIEELLVAGCYPRELLGALYIEGLAIASLLAFAGMPILLLSILTTGGSPARAVITAGAEVVGAFLFVIIGLALQGANRSLSTSTHTIRSIIIHALWFFSLLAVGLHLLGNPALPFFFRVMSGLSPLDAVLSAARTGDPRWHYSLPLFLLVEWVAGRAVIQQATRFGEDIELLLDPAQRRIHSAGIFTLRVSRQSESSAHPPLDFSTGNPIRILDEKRGLKLRLSSGTSLLFLLLLMTPLQLIWPHLHLSFADLLWTLIWLLFPARGALGVAISFEQDVETRRLESLMLTRLSAFEILWGKLAASFSSAWLHGWPALLLGLLIIGQIWSGRLLSLGFAGELLGILLYSLVTAAAAGLIGVRCRTAVTAALVGILVAEIPVALAFGLTRIGAPWGCVLCPLASVLMQRSSCLLTSLLLYVILTPVVLLAGARALKHAPFHHESD